MRVLFASTQGAGHYNPLVPFIGAARERGHEVLVVVPPALAATVEAAGYEARIGADPPEDELGAVWGRVQQASFDEANRLVIGDIFARLDTQAMLPTLRAACREWRPDLVLREPSEFASAVAAEELGITHARIAVGLADMEALSLEIAAPVLDTLCSGVTERIRESALVTLLPERVDPARFPCTLRLSEPPLTEAPQPLPSWWGEAGGPLVYVTFGSVAGGLPMAGAAYRAALDAVADKPVRVLLTIGRHIDPSLVGAPAANVHVESWVPQRDVLGHAAAVVGHGGFGTTLGTLAAGLPAVLVPLFADQPLNARRVEEVGAGLSVAADADAIRSALEAVLADESYREAAAAAADEMRRLPPVDEAFELVAA